MDEILIVNKETDWTSRDVVNEVSKILGTKKVGHTGTLDPLATGVLVLCIGKCTKLVELLTMTDKEYEAKVVLGVETDTLDITGKVLKKEKVHKSEEEIRKVLKSFEKTYQQEVPIYSAVKIKGKKLYEYAREGKEVLLPKREVCISKIELCSVEQKKDGTHFTFKVAVSKGTYIRSLIRDIAEVLGTYGSMEALCRTRQGTYKIEDAYKIEDIREGHFQFLSMESALSSYTKVVISKEVEEKIRNGSILEDVYGTSYPLFVNEQGHLLALYKPYKENLLKPFKMILEEK